MSTQQNNLKNNLNDGNLESFGYHQELKRALSIWDLLVYGMIFMVPIAPFGVFGYLYDGANGMVPLAYIIGMIAMFFTAMSYWTMSRAFPIAGSVYTYAQKGIHEIVGFFAGWVILLDYILVPALLYIVSAAALSDLVPSVPQWGWLVIFIAINTIINWVGIEFTAKANRYILIAEIIVLLIFVVLGLTALYGSDNATGLTMKPIYDADKFSLPLVFGAVSIAVLSFLGFDGISTLSEETKDGPDSVGKASLLALLIVGTLFILQTWIAVDLAKGQAFSNPDTAFYQTAEMAGGNWLKLLTQWSTILSWGIANALVAQAAVSRILFSMGRDRQLPSILAKVHPKYKTPHISIILVACISLIVGYLFIGHIDTLSSIVNFGALVAFMVLHCSVINYFMIRNRSKHWIKHLLIPVFGLIIIGKILIEMSPEAKLLGLEWFGLGVVYYLLSTYVFKNRVNFK